MKYLHLMTNDKFNSGYIKFIEENFDMEEHLFVFWSGASEDEIKILDRDNIFKIKNFVHKTLLMKYLYKSEKIFLHGLHNKRLNKMLYYNQGVLKKCIWIIWGGDLHAYEIPKTTRKEKKKEFYRKNIIKKFGGYISLFEEEYNLCKKWYESDGKFYPTFNYPSNLFNEIKIEEKKEEKIVIQIGNSALKRNNHIEVLDKLAKYKDENIEIICPLSYGDEKNAISVKEYGEEMFGQKFIGLLEFLEYDKYIELLKSVDIAIFNHKKHQAMGNIITLLGMGKKVYLNKEDFITKKVMDSLKVNTFDVSGEILLGKLTEKEKELNVKIVRERFSKKKLKEELEYIFND